MDLKLKINTDQLPKHLAIIMDGNGRWAKQKGLMRAIGHENGTKSVRQAVEASAELGIENLTLYAFSTGNLDDLPKKAQKELKEVIESTKDNSRMILTLALSYGSREEIINTVKKISLKVKNNIISPENIDESVINEHLYTRNLHDVDLLIRTSGEQRISNFLLWQIAYAELYFTNVLWPDFTKQHLYEAIIDYQKRERRFWKTSEQIN